jgi:hypothetical protein
VVPERALRVRIHEVASAIHTCLLDKYGYDTDIVFTRPNYRKIDLPVDVDRGGVEALIADALPIGKTQGLDVQATTDAKFLEVGMTTKADNIDYLLEHVAGGVPAFLEFLEAQVDL